MLAFVGFYNDLERAWYADVGAKLMTTMFIMLAGSCTVRFVVSELVKPIIINFKKKNCVTQSQLEEVFTGARFEIELRYADHLKILFSGMLLQGALPVMAPILALYFWGQYFSDRWLLVKRYQKPPAYDEKLALKVADWLPYAAYLQLAFAAFAFSNPRLLASGHVSDSLAMWLRNPTSAAAAGVEYAESQAAATTRAWLGGALLMRLNRTNVFPMVVVLAAALAWRVLHGKLGRALNAYLEVRSLTRSRLTLHDCLATLGGEKYRVEKTLRRTYIYIYHDCPPNSNKKHGLAFSRLAGRERGAVARTAYHRDCSSLNLDS